MKGQPISEQVANGVARSKDPIELFDKTLITSTTPFYSDMVECAAFRNLILMLGIKSTGAPTTLRIELQFLSRWDGQWYTYKEGPFAALYWEDTDTATLQQEAFMCPVGGRAVRVKLTGVGTTAAAYFAVTAALDFVN